MYLCDVTMPQSTEPPQATMVKRRFGASLDLFPWFCVLDLVKYVQNKIIDISLAMNDNFGCLFMTSDRFALKIISGSPNLGQKNIILYKHISFYIQLYYVIKWFT